MEPDSKSNFFFDCCNGAVGQSLRCFLMGNDRMFQIFKDDCCNTKRNRDNQQNPRSNSSSPGSRYSVQAALAWFVHNAPVYPA
eukprot:768463-Hanusia_phi.AAC.2